MRSQSRKESGPSEVDIDNRGCVDDLLSSLQNGTSRLSHVLQRQEEATGVSMSTAKGLSMEVDLSTGATFTSTAPGATIAILRPGHLDSGHEQEDEDSCGDDLTDRQTEERTTKSLSPTSTGLESSASQARPHAAVEKRYRRTVNTKLQQLYASIPASGKFELKDEHQQNEMRNVNAGEQAAKPAVLDKAIQYVTHLIDTYHKYDQDIQELRKQVRELIDEDGDGQQANPNHYERPVDMR
ncbi:helix-loop-helix DNA-binding domain-containing [Lecanosticta acicola]|uniref:Helix-loop-helix DNA-binding domain-containing n=1 Tax=Lecanosticta acicola TaxID=111012 RepID=A0AAI8Z4R3_9PEZI|nr:helix-loop-helix DNA-binding domain-containing [Lecanosticta acicola]